MTRHVLVGLQTAAAVLLACGVVIGVVPLSAVGSDCPAPFSTASSTSSGLLELDVACAEQRSQRQLAAAVVLTLGGALLAGATGFRRSTTLEEGRTASSVAGPPLG
ncbi:MAG: hypothetical protein PGN11_00275 [Quadrisphaera sp.]